MEKKCRKNRNVNALSSVFSPVQPYVLCSFKTFNFWTVTLWFRVRALKNHLTSNSVPLLFTAGKRGVLKRPWSEAERAAVEEHLTQNINELRVPAKADCERCLQQCPLLVNNHRDWRAIKFYCHNRIQLLKKNQRRESEPQPLTVCWGGGFWVGWEPVGCLFWCSWSEQNLKWYLLPTKCTNFERTVLNLTLLSGSAVCFWHGF